MKKSVAIKKSGRACMAFRVYLLMLLMSKAADVLIIDGLRGCRFGERRAASTCHAELHFCSSRR